MGNQKPDLDLFLVSKPKVMKAKENKTFPRQHEEKITLRDTTLKLIFGTIAHEFSWHRYELKENTV